MPFLESAQSTYIGKFTLFWPLLRTYMYMRKLQSLLESRRISWQLEWSGPIFVASWWIHAILVQEKIKKKSTTQVSCSKLFKILKYDRKDTPSSLMKKKKCLKKKKKYHSRCCVTVIIVHQVRSYNLCYSDINFVFLLEAQACKYIYSPLHWAPKHQRSPYLYHLPRLAMISFGCEHRNYCLPYFLYLPNCLWFCNNCE